LIPPGWDSITGLLKRFTNLGSVYDVVCTLSLSHLWAYIKLYVFYESEIMHNRFEINVMTIPAASIHL
jgi:hypothetical protein